MLKIPKLFTRGWYWNYHLPVVEIEVICQWWKLKSASGSTCPAVSQANFLSSVEASSLPNTKWLLRSVTISKTGPCLFFTRIISLQSPPNSWTSFKPGVSLQHGIVIDKASAIRKSFHISSQFTILCLVDFIAFLGHMLLDTPATLLHTQPRSSHPKKF